MIFSSILHHIVYPFLSNLLFFSWRNECPPCDQWPTSHLRIKFLCFLRHLLQIAKPPIPICIRGQNIGNAATEIWDFPIINSNFPRNICKMLCCLFLTIYLFFRTTKIIHHNQRKSTNWTRNWNHGCGWKVGNSSLWKSKK